MGEKGLIQDEQEQETEEETTDDTTPTGARGLTEDDEKWIADELEERAKQAKVIREELAKTDWKAQHPNTIDKEDIDQILKNPAEDPNKFHWSVGGESSVEDGATGQQDGLDKAIEEIKNDLDQSILPKSLYQAEAGDQVPSEQHGPTPPPKNPAASSQPENPNVQDGKGQSESR